MEAMMNKTMNGTLSQSAIELASNLVGNDWTMSQLLLKARAYLIATGTKKPGQAMTWTLASAVDELIKERVLFGEVA
jgi:hypothetical protein